MVMKAGSETGSLINHLMSGAKAPEPEVGMGATILCWTDREPVTIIKVSPTRIEVQADKWTRTDQNGMDESQSYTYEPNPNGPVTTFRKTKKGWRSPGGNGLLVGSRNRYHDFSF